MKWLGECVVVLIIEMTAVRKLLFSTKVFSTLLTHKKSIKNFLKGESSKVFRDEEFILKMNDIMKEVNAANNGNVASFFGLGFSEYLDDDQEDEDIENDNPGWG